MTSRNLLNLIIVLKNQQSKTIALLTVKTFHAQRIAKAASEVGRLTGNTNMVQAIIMQMNAYVLQTFK